MHTLKSTSSDWVTASKFNAFLSMSRLADHQRKWKGAVSSIQLMVKQNTMFGARVLKRATQSLALKDLKMVTQRLEGIQSHGSSVVSPFVVKYPTMLNVDFKSIVRATVLTFLRENFCNAYCIKVKFLPEVPMTPLSVLDNTRERSKHYDYPDSYPCTCSF